MKIETIKLLEGKTISIVDIDKLEFEQIRSELIQAKKNATIVLKQMKEQLKNR